MDDIIKEIKQELKRREKEYASALSSGRFFSLEEVDAYIYSGDEEIIKLLIDYIEQFKKENRREIW